MSKVLWKAIFLSRKLRVFSKIAIDQVHEQNNDLIKNNGGATHLLNRADSISLEKWEITTPELTRLISEFEDNFFINPNKPSAHHEETQSFQKRFSTDVYKLYESMIYNPLQHKKLVKINNISMIYNPFQHKKLEDKQYINDLQSLAT